jgi:hypothetical protein
MPEGSNGSARKDAERPAASRWGKSTTDGAGVGGQGGGAAGRPAAIGGPPWAP